MKHDRQHERHIVVTLKNGLCMRCLPLRTIGSSYSYWRCRASGRPFTSDARAQPVNLCTNTGASGHYIPSILHDLMWQQWDIVKRLYINWNGSVRKMFSSLVQPMSRSFTYRSYWSLAVLIRALLTGRGQQVSHVQCLTSVHTDKATQLL